MKWIVKNVRKRRKQRKGGRMTLLIAPYNAPTLNEGERMSSPRFSRSRKEGAEVLEWKYRSAPKKQRTMYELRWKDWSIAYLYRIGRRGGAERARVSTGLIPESHEALKRNRQDGKGWRRKNNLCPQWMRTARGGGAECLSEEEEGKTRRRKERNDWGGEWKRRPFYGLRWKEAKKEECNSTVENGKNSTTWWRLIPYSVHGRYSEDIPCSVKTANARHSW